MLMPTRQQIIQLYDGCPKSTVTRLAHTMFSGLRCDAQLMRLHATSALSCCDVKQHTGWLGQTWQNHRQLIILILEVLLLWILQYNTPFNADALLQHMYWVVPPVAHTQRLHRMPAIVIYGLAIYFVQAHAHLYCGTYAVDSGIYNASFTPPLH